MSYYTRHKFWAKEFTFNYLIFSYLKKEKKSMNFSIYGNFNPHFSKVYKKI